MKTRILLALSIALTGSFVEAATAGVPSAGTLMRTADSSVAAVPLRVAVDPRVELLSILFHLAGNPEYNQPRVASYTADVEKQFGRYRSHPAVELARRLRSTRGISYDACMSMAVHLSDAYELQPIVALEPWPDGLDRRWTAEDASNFLAAARLFVRDTSFKQFIEQHQSLYEITASRMRKVMEADAHLEWFYDYFGERPKAEFTVALGLLNGPMCYGPHRYDATGREEMFCILGVWQTDNNGQPEFTRDMLGTVIHEFCHSYANPIMDRHQAELEAAGRKLFEPMADRMRSQAYGNAQTMLRESLVRASTVRYHHRYGGAEAAQRAVQEENRRGFVWTGELSDLLAKFEAQPDRYPTLESFAPRLVSFFNEYADTFATQQVRLETKRPKVVSIIPANGATAVDPGLSEIQVAFDRPMKNGSWSMVGGGPHFPELAGRPSYNATRTTWSVAVKLKPDWDYEFRLNSGEYDMFRSQEDIPLQPVHVTFRTTSLTKD